MAAGGSSAATFVTTGPVLINEVLAINKNGVKDAKGKAADWVELHNTGSSAVDLEGYVLSDGSNSWSIPSGVRLEAGAYQLIFATGKDDSTDTELHADFKIGATDVFLSLADASGVLISVVPYPAATADVSFGVVGPSERVQASSVDSAPLYSLLETPTPGTANSGALAGGPIVVGTTRNPSPRPNGSAGIPVQTTVLAPNSAIASVVLQYIVNYEAAVNLAMTAGANGVYSATIPKAAVPAGTLIRWAVVATDDAGKKARDPNPAADTDPQHFGTIVEDTTDTSTLPIFELYSADDNAPWSTGPESGGQAVTGGKGYVDGCSLWFNGTYYDNISMRRKGSTSLAWPKPKMRITAGKQGKTFETSEGYKVKSFTLSSNWAEPGENTFMREPLVWQTFKEMGVDNLEAYQSHVRFNGAYFGRFIYVEDWTEESLDRNGYDTSDIGALFKSESGEYSNLRWDLPADQVPYYWNQEEPKADVTSELLDLTKGLAGEGASTRETYLFDGINLPKVINYMAGQTLILNQDRCTKNYFVYRDTLSGQWSMLPWDVESGYGIDRGLGGVPAPDYCILACEQWNSPLYCDHNHVQDLTVSTPWTLILSNYSLGVGSAAAGRRLLQYRALADVTSAPANGAAVAGLALPANSTISAVYEGDQTKLGTPSTGANGTLNYMLDSVLSIPRTRSMYVRRLRTLMDTFATGRLEALVTQFYNQVKEEAERDNAKWGNPGTPERGYQQLTTEQLPIRKSQLFNTYSIKGPIPLIPDSQPNSFSLSIGAASANAGGYVEVVNNNAFAVDISGAKMTGAIEFTFLPGTVLAAGDTVHVAGDVVKFIKEMGGAGLFAVGPYSGSIQGPAASVAIENASGGSFTG